MPAFVYWLAGTMAANGDARCPDGRHVVAFTTLQSRLFFPLGQLLNVQVEIQGSLALFDRIFEYLEMDPEIVDAPDAVALDHASVRAGSGSATSRSGIPGRRCRRAGRTRRPPRTSRNGQWRWRPWPSVAAWPEPTRSTTSPNALTAPIGRMASTTPTPCPRRRRPSSPSRTSASSRNPASSSRWSDRPGAGKTTTTYLIPRLYDVDSGAVEIDDIDVRKIKLASLGESD